MRYVICDSCGKTLPETRLAHHRKSKACQEQTIQRLGREPINGLEHVRELPPQWRCCRIPFDSFDRYFRHKLSAHTVRFPVGGLANVSSIEDNARG